MKGFKGLLLFVLLCVNLFASFVDYRLEAVFDSSSKTATLLELKSDRHYIFVSSNSLENIKKAEKIIAKSNIADKIHFDLLDSNPSNQVTHIKDIDTKTIRQKLNSLKENIKTSALYTPINIDDPLDILPTKRPSITSNNGYLTLDSGNYLLISMLKTTDTADIVSLANTLNSLHNITAFSPQEYHHHNQVKTKKNVFLLISIGLFLLFALYYLVLRNLKLIILHFCVQIPVFIVASFFVFTYFGSIHIFTIAFGLSFSSIGVDYLLHNYLGGYLKNKKLSLEVFFGFLSTFLGFVVLFFLLDMMILKQIALYSSISILLNYLIYSFAFQKLNIGSKKRDINIVVASIKGRYFVIFTAIIAIYSLFLYRTDLDISTFKLPAPHIDKRADIFTSNISKSEYFYDASSFEKIYAKCESLKNQIDSFESFCDNCTLHRDVLEKKLQGIKSTLQKEAELLGFKDGFFEDSYNPKLIAKECKKQDVIKIEDRYYAKASANRSDVDLGHNLISPLEIAKKEISNNQHNLYISFTTFFILLTSLVLIFSKNRVVSMIFLITPLVFAVFATLTIYGALNILHIFSLMLALLVLVDFSLYVNNKHGRESIFYAALTTLFGFGILVFSSLPALFSIGVVISSAMIGVLVLNSFLKRET